MKSIIDLSPFTKYGILSNRTSGRKPIINNNKFYTTSNQTLNLNIKSSDKNTNKNNINVKNNVGKNNLINKTQNQSKEKSKSKSKSRDEIYFTNRILKNTLKYPESSINDKNSIGSSSKSNTQRTFNKISIKIYEKAIDKLFLYMKKILPNEIYKDIQNKFLIDISKELNNYNNKTNMKKEDSITSSITNLIKTMINNSINIDDFSSINNNHHNNKIKLPYNIGNDINIISSNKINNLIKKHTSLYTLTKSKILNSKTMSNSKSKSKSGSKSPSNSKSKNEHNKNNKKVSMKKFIFGNHKTTLNLKLFEKINSELLKIDFKPISKKKIFSDKKQIKNIKKNNSPNIKDTHNRNNKISNICEIIISNGSNNNTIRNSLKKKEKHSKSNFSLNFKINNKNNNLNDNKENSKSSEKNKKIISNNNDNNIIKEIINESKNSEQLKEIKSSLDENLKKMFNFSYEDFLNKESETESKKSIDDNLGNSNNFSSITRGVYKSKYQI